MQASYSSKKRDCLVNILKNKSPILRGDVEKSFLSYFASNTLLRNNILEYGTSDT